MADRLAQILAARQTGLADLPPTAAGAHVTYLYDRASAGAYVPPGSRQAAAFAWQGRGDRSGAGQEPAIPSLLDLIALDPPLLTYEPGELLIPGTWIPLILPRDEAVDVAWTALD